MKAKNWNTKTVSDLESDFRSDLGQPKAWERPVFGALFITIALLVATDLVSDYQDGGSSLHMSIELLIAFFSGLGAVILLGSHFRSKKELLEARSDYARLKEQAEIWRKESESHMAGLSQAIDAQFVRWGLSESEKEVALLLLKGLSLKEIATVRKTAEKTARAQSVAVYEKSNLAGRSELSAFFLEDLLSPQSLNR